MPFRRSISRSLFATRVGQSKDAADGPAARRGRCGAPPPESRRVLEVLREVRGVHEELLRDAPDVDAGAAEEAFLGHRDAGAVAGRDAGRPGPSGPCPDDEEIEVEVAH